MRSARNGLLAGAFVVALAVLMSAATRPAGAEWGGPFTSDRDSLRALVQLQQAQAQAQMRQAVALERIAGALERLEAHLPPLPPERAPR